MSASSGESVERNCALCLVVLPPKTDSKVCKKCYEKHNNHTKYGSFAFPSDSEQTGAEPNTKSLIDSLPDNYCNLCQKSFTTPIELEEHLIEHSFRGCEERGYNCYICSAIFTLPAGLHQHMIEHGPSYRPYDCNLCAKKFYFRAELENHLIDHEIGRIDTPNQSQSDASAVDNLGDSEHPASNGHKPQLRLKHEHDSHQNQMKESNDDSASEKESADLKSNEPHYANETNAVEHDDEDDDEYIEVEQIAENPSINDESQSDIKERSSERDEQDKDNRNDDGDDDD